MRIVAGLHRGRQLASPAGLSTRPTSDRARQAVFNIIEHAGWKTRDLLDGADVLDVFAGTGAMGLEALSRGARHAVFVEQNPAALKSCAENIETLGEGEHSHVLCSDVLKLRPRGLHFEPRTLVFLDPPYGKGLGAKALTLLAEGNWLADNAVCILEMAKKEPEQIPPGFTVHDTRDYGVARVMFLEYTGVTRP